MSFIFFSFCDFFSIIRKFFYKSVVMKDGEGEAARTNLCEISTTNPFFPLTGPSMGGAKVLSTTNLANESTKNPCFSFTGPSMVSAQVLLMCLIYCRSSYGSSKKITAIFNSYNSRRDHR